MKLPIKNCQTCPLYHEDSSYGQGCAHPDMKVELDYLTFVYSGRVKEVRHKACPLNNGSITIVADT